jgi:hypothetical protein
MTSPPVALSMWVCPQADAARRACPQIPTPHDDEACPAAMPRVPARTGELT